MESQNRKFLPPESDNEDLFDFNRDPMDRKFGLSCLGKLPVKKSAEIESSMLGIGFETLDRDTFDPHDTFEILAESGIKWARCQTGWLKCEKEPGVYDFAWLDDVVDNLLKIGIQPWFSASFGNPLYTPVEKYRKYMDEHPNEQAPGIIRGYVGEVPLYHGEKAVTAWKNYLKALAAHFKGRVTHWEIWNEPDGLGHFWMHKGEAPYGDCEPLEQLKKCAKDYVKLVRISSEVIREVIPDVKIIADVAQPLTEYTRTLGEEGLADIMDIFSYHTYNINPEHNAREHYNYVNAIFNDSCKKVEIWQGESGKATDKSALSASFAPTEYGQAKYITRRYMIDFTNNTKLASFFTVTDFKNYYPDGSDQYYGVINARKKCPKLGFFAMQSMAWLLEGAQLAPDLNIYFNKPQGLAFGSVLPFFLQTASFRRKGIPVFSAYIPETIEMSATPVTGEIALSVGDLDKFRNPVIIDPIRQNVYKFSDDVIETPPWAKGRMVIRPITFTDYPLFITDMAALEDK